MPAISFEKIAPTDRHGHPMPTKAPIEQKRGVIVQVLGRFVDARMKRSDRVDQGTLVRRPHDLPK